jgi:hypothetical protein
MHVIRCFYLSLQHLVGKVYPHPLSYVLGHIFRVVLSINAWDTLRDRNMKHYFQTIFRATRSILTFYYTGGFPFDPNMEQKRMGVPFAPFPSTEITTPLKRPSLAKIVHGDETEASNLYSSCQELGFFLLDMQDTQQGRHILKDAKELLQLATQIFELDLQEKEKFAMLNGTVFG